MNKTRILSFTACLMILLLLGNAAHSGTFAKKLADVGSLQKTIRTSDGGYVLAINDSDANRIVLRRIDSKGKKAWQRQLVSPDQETIEARGLGLAIDGGIFLAVNHLIGVDSNSRIAVLKLDARGRIQWNSAFQGRNCCNFEPTVARFDSIVGTADGGALAAGSTCGGPDCFLDGLALVKFSKAGKVEWSKTFKRYLFITVQLVQTSDGGFMVGASSGIASAPSPTLLIRLNSSGEIKWKKLLKYLDFGIGLNYRDAFQATPDGGVIVVSVPYNKGKLLSVKLDSGGNFVWKKATTFENFPITGAGVAVNSSPEGGYVFFGSVTSGGGEYDAFLAKAGADGTIQSVSVFDGNSFDDFDSVYPNADGSIVLFGHEIVFAPPGVFFSGFDSNGDVPGCSFPSSPKPIKSSFGKLSIKGVKIEEQSLSMIHKDLAIKSKKFNKQASDLCP